MSFKEVDHIIHAGDILDLKVIHTLEKLAPVTAVAGNVDSREIFERFGEKKILPFDSFRFGIFHGHGKKGKTMDRAIEAFEENLVDCIIFGHSHIPYCGYHGNTLLFNPGSPTDKRRNPYYSFGIIEVTKSLSPELIYFGPEEK